MGKLTLGSLFSGSGGFELAGTLAGIEPVWNSEIAPFPIRVTSKRFPNVKHYGDINDINVAEKLCRKCSRKLWSDKRDCAERPRRSKNKYKQ